jgi:hypothetical protein
MSIESLNIICRLLSLSVSELNLGTTFDINVAVFNKLITITPTEGRYNLPHVGYRTFQDLYSNKNALEVAINRIRHQLLKSYKNLPNPQLGKYTLPWIQTGQSSQGLTYRFCLLPLTEIIELSKRPTDRNKYYG